jgi:hypothetical protein
VLPTAGAMADIKMPPNDEWKGNNSKRIFEVFE